jgi:DHA1 family inner membrane transport protein
MGPLTWLLNAVRGRRECPRHDAGNCGGGDSAFQGPTMIMTESAPAYPTRPSNGTFWAAGALGILATAVAAILPVLVGVWQKQAGLQVDQAGFVAAMELFAQVAGTGVFLWASPRWALRTIAVAGLCVMVVGSIATAVSADFASLMAARAIGGAGGGVIRALCMMSLAKALSPGRAFAVYAGAQVGLAAMTTAIIPHVIETYGVHAPFLVLTLASALGLPLCPLLPRTSPLSPRSSPLPPSAMRQRGPASYPMAGILAIVALFVFFVGQGALWTYLAPIGAYRSIPAAGVTQALTLLNFAGLAGALGVGALAHRVSPRMALLTLLATEILSIVGLFQVHSSAGFIASAGVFYFSWCASFPFQFTVISQSDRSGRASAVVPAADGLGLAGGAALGSVVLPALGLGSSGWICAAASVVGITLYIGSATLSKMPARSLERPGAADAAALER